ncbi:hypothetical protein AUK40_04775 [Candidatus Wirthbacteria bacterium CG2_30_54_11]|uniref:Uncharacterized protein n=1 Tax=Candidatus Wirthbacteria bacterium CG2_30_54_11 TaxID=1817892 RepID=A0A1J5IIW9_9BACT|nr:MAG: hypothetical protein AUK40_04775 [Candidatus Wirthbacteria bacterium CG2_30_54_11]
MDSNIGINKVNFFATRSVSYTVDRTEDNELIAKVEINYNNPSNWGWPGGAYISYLRVYVPSGSELISEQGFLQKPGTATEYAGQAKEKTVFAGVVKVDIKSRQTVRLSYRLPVSLEGQEYRLTVQKQAGTPTLPGRPDYRGEAFTFSFSDEQNIYDGGAGDGTCAIDGSLLTCATDLSVDRIFTVAPRGI